MANKVAKRRLTVDTMVEDKDPVQLVHGGIPVGPEEYHRRKNRIEERVQFCVEREAKEREEAVEAHKEPNLITNFPLDLSGLFKEVIETFGPQSVYAENTATTITGDPLPGFMALRTICTEDEDIEECIKEWHSHANMYIRDWFRENGITLADTYDPERRMDMLGWGDHPEVVITEEPDESPNQPCDCSAGREPGDDACKQSRDEGNCPCCEHAPNEPDPGPDVPGRMPYFPKHSKEDEED